MRYQLSLHYIERGLMTLILVSNIGTEAHSKSKRNSRTKDPIQHGIQRSSTHPARNWNA